MEQPGSLLEGMKPPVVRLGGLRTFLSFRTCSLLLFPACAGCCAGSLLRSSVPSFLPVGSVWCRRPRGPLEVLAPSAFRRFCWVAGHPAGSAPCRSLSAAPARKQSLGLLSARSHAQLIFKQNKQTHTEVILLRRNSSTVQVSFIKYTIH